MPRKELHNLIEKMMLGKLTGMSELMDSASSVLHSHHRIIGHDPVQIALFSLMKGGNFLDNLKAGLLHTLLDESFTEGKKALVKYERKVNKKRAIRK